MSKKTYIIQLSNKSQKFLDKIDEELRKSIYIILEDIREDPHEGNLLQGNLSGIWSWRFSKYRILYRITEEKIELFIIDIGLRKKIY